MTPAMPQTEGDRRRAPREVLKRPPASRLESQFVKLTSPDGRSALWIRLSSLRSANGFRRTSEAWAVLFERVEGGELRKTALRQTHELRAAANDDSGFRVGDCEITADATRGAIQTKGRQLSWDLRAETAQDVSFRWIPAGLTRAGLTRTEGGTLGADLRFTGTVTLDGEERRFEAAPGMRGQLQGDALAYSWIWGHCNSFENERGEPVYAIFEGMSARSRILGALPSPRLSTFLFVYQDRTFALNTFWDAVRSRSRHSFTEWAFQADHEEFSFRGRLKAEHRDFAGVTYEDTDGSLVHGANAQLADLTLSIYRRGKLEVTLRGPGTASLEVGSRSRNPYVPTLF